MDYDRKHRIDRLGWKRVFRPYAVTLIVGFMILTAMMEFLAAYNHLWAAQNDWKASNTNLIYQNIKRH